jgi:potassium/sodium efflux P-type ATPase
MISHGPNRLTPPEKISRWQVFFAQFNNTLVYVLLVSAMLTAIFEHWLDAGVILGVVVLNALIGFVQEGKAEKALDAIRNLISPRALVVRDGHRDTIDSENLVPGDIVFLQSGDKVPADLRMFKVKNLRIDEASLTGESMPAEKTISAVSESASIGDRNCMAFSGTLVTSGQGSGIVVATGDRTEIGKISSLISSSPAITTKLLLKMAEFGRWLSMGVTVVTVIVFGFGVFVRKYPLSEMFIAAVGLAVAAIPEGLPAILSITLAVGVQRMAKRNAIIRRLPSVETLGSVTVICSDKTGTLTRNEMTVQIIVTASDRFDVGGVGYDPAGIFTVRGKELTCYMIDDSKVRCADYPDLMDLAMASVLCNDAAIEQSGGLWQIHGDPTEAAALVMGMKAGYDNILEQKNHTRLDVIPFESEHRFMATLNQSPEGDRTIYVKGAPERIMEMCSQQRAEGRDSAINRDYWAGQIQLIAGLGQRTLAVAAKPVTRAHSGLSFEDVAGEMTLLGILGIIDPPRGSAISAIRQCRDAGIRVKMITGDHVLTARAIGTQMGIGDGVTAVTGQELDGIDDDKLRNIVTSVDIFARVSPEHKLRLVQSLQSNGEVVAMTGDGVNDAPALKRADIGVAMGIKGTEAAKEAAEMVLADDNFATIASAVEEGRTVYENLKKAIMYILPTNIGEAGIIIAAIMMGRMLPITPVQILWVNMITTVTLALSLSFEPPEPEIMKRPPRDAKEPILTKFLIWRVVFVSLILMAGTFGLFLYNRINGVSIEAARTIAVNALVFFEIFFLFAVRYLKATVFTREGFFGNGYVIGAVGAVIGLQMIFTYAGPMQKLFGTVPLEFRSWIAIIITSSLVLFLVEFEKWVIRKIRININR